MRRGPRCGGRKIDSCFEAKFKTNASKLNRKLSGSALSKKPNHVDQHVARQLRLWRVLLGMSQEDLAQRLGGSPQKVQKCEAGETRISASRTRHVRTLSGPMGPNFLAMSSAVAVAPPDIQWLGSCSSILTHTSLRKVGRRCLRPRRERPSVARGAASSERRPGCP
jgi:DNA-binding transcriptional regulator YiaG